MDGVDTIIADALESVAQALPGNAPVVAFYGKRVGDRPIAVAARCAILETDAGSLPSGFAPSSARLFTLYLARAAWRDETDPQEGEWVRAALPGGANPVWVKLENVSHLATGDFRLVASYLPKRQGGPEWCA